MSLDATVPRSRRALLAAALGAAAATVAGAIGRPAPVSALDPNDVVLGTSNTATSPTTVNNTRADNRSFAGTAIKGVSTAGTGVWGVGGSGPGVYGESSVTAGDGVSGLSNAGAGLFGTSRTGAGAAGYAFQDGVGIMGRTWSAPPDLREMPPLPTKVGVYGETFQTTGVGGYFTSVSGGTALAVNGKARFSRAKKVTIGAGKSSLKVYLTGVTASSLVFAVLHSNRSGVYVRAVTPATGSFTIYLNKAVTSATYIAYFVVN
jgi:hypothetical protein